MEPLNWGNRNLPYISFMQIPFSNQASIAIVGVPFDAHSSFLPGAAKAPAAIRKALRSPSANMCTESMIDLNTDHSWIDVGDIEVDDYHSDIESGVAEILDSGMKPITLGGDHSITYPIIRAVSNKYKNLNILQLDAHGDLYDDFEGNRYSHACPFARIMEEGLAGRLIQVGIRTLSPHQKEQVEKFEVEVIEVRDFSHDLSLELHQPAYLSLDLDVLDPAFAPGLSHHEPGGLSTREVISIIQNLGVPLVGADIVELNPDRDINGVTSMVAAKLLKEILDQMINNPG